MKQAVVVVRCIAGVSYHIITSFYLISVSCCTTVWRRRLINKREYSCPTDGRRTAPCRTASRLNGAKKKKEKRGGGRKKGMRERRRGNRGATRQKRRPDRRARHDPGFPRSFPAYCFPLRIRLRAPSSTLASASRRIYAFIRAGRRPHPRLTPEGAEVKRQGRKCR